jgi:hypothetical protein
MNSSGLKTTCNVLSVVDFLLIGGMFFYFQRKINNIEKGGVNSDTFITASESVKKESSSKIMEKRVLRLEKDNEVLIQRMQFYDELFSKILSHIKENKDHQQLQKILEHPPGPAGPAVPSVSPVRKTHIQRRSKVSLFVKKEPFADGAEGTEGPEGADEDFDFTMDDEEMMSENGTVNGTANGSPGTEGSPANTDLPEEDDDYEEDMFSYLKN